ncbi:hypothetical protein ACFV1B_11445 [Streptomyces sp. NPDC059637]|uniref:hypothetical protein n=1 Tax=Streptomyces sp. NPDC059637 TaxID=3347752 RepID=UPI0036CCA1EE
MGRHRRSIPASPSASARRTRFTALTAAGVSLGAGVAAWALVTAPGPAADGTVPQAAAAPSVLQAPASTGGPADAGPGGPNPGATVDTASREDARGGRSAGTGGKAVREDATAPDGLGKKPAAQADRQHTEPRPPGPADRPPAPDRGRAPAPPAGGTAPRPPSTGTPTPPAPPAAPAPPAQTPEPPAAPGGTGLLTGITDLLENLLGGLLGR